MRQKEGKFIPHNRTAFISSKGYVMYMLFDYMIISKNNKIQERKRFARIRF